MAALPAASSFATSSSSVASTVTRIGGADSYATAVALSRAYFDGPVPAVLVASGQAFPDGLSASPLAEALGAPVLLVKEHSIPDGVKAELQRLRPGRIIVLGGTRVISRRVMAALGAYAGDVDRVAGTDRYATSAAISAAAFKGRVATAYVATGANFPDALSAAAVAAERGQPLLLVGRTRVPATVIRELRRLHPGRIVITGGSSAITERAAAQLRRLGGSVVRIGAADRYGTAAAISAASYPPARGGSLFLVSGQGFADALVAGPIAASLDAPLLLTSRGSLSAAARREIARLQPDRIVVVGGTNRISEKVMLQLAELVRQWQAPPDVQPTPAPTASATPAPTAVGTPTPTRSPAATRTPAPTASATPAATRAPTPTVAATATPVPTDRPPVVSGSCPGPVHGHGASTVGGNAAAVRTVSSLDALRAAVAETGSRNVRLSGSGTWNLAGRDLHISHPNITIDGAGSGIVFRGGSIKITTSQVILCNLRSRAGDDYGVGADLDAITINGIQTPVSNIVLSHVEALWAPDVSLVALGSVSKLTVQYSIMGEGLLRSAHPESTEDLDGHSLSGNFAGTGANGITVYGSLITTSQSRQPRTIATNGFDLIDSVLYNYDEGPQGNPVCANIIGNTFKWGPAPGAAGLGAPTRLLFRYTPGAEDGSLNASSVYVAGNRTIGFTEAAPTGEDAQVRRSTPCGSPAASIGAAAAYAMVLEQAGVRAGEDAQTRRLIANVVNGTGVYYSGSGYPGPNPGWP